MLFFRSKLKNIFKSWIPEVSQYYKGLLNPIISEGKNISDEEALGFHKECMNQYFKRASDLIHNSNNPNAILKWTNLPLCPNLCGIEVDYNNLSIGAIFAMTYYCFEGKEVKINDYTELNHLHHDSINRILIELSNYYGG